MAVKNYRDLNIWQKGMDLVEQIYALTAKFPKQEQFGLTSQIQRSAVSIPSNIAEGQGRKNDNEFRRFLHIALGSLAELDTQLEISVRLGYVNSESLTPVVDLMLELRRMIFGLINNLSKE